MQFLVSIVHECFIDSPLHNQPQVLLRACSEFNMINRVTQGLNISYAYKYLLDVAVYLLNIKDEIRNVAKIASIITKM